MKLNQFHFSIRFSVLFFISISLISCAAEVNFKENLQSSSLCCKHYSEMQFKKLGYNTSLFKRIGEKGTPSRIFKEGQSYFLPVELPKFSGAYEVQIESTPTNKQLFVPRVLLLNATYEVVDMRESKNFFYSGGKASYKFFINEDKDYRYMVLYAPKSDLGKEGVYTTMVETSTPIYAGGYVFNYRSGVDAKESLITAEGGNIKIKIKKYELRTVTRDTNIDS